MSEHTPLTEAEREALTLAMCAPDPDRAPVTEIQMLYLVAAVERLLAARTSAATADTGLRERVEALADEWSTPESHREGAWIRHRDAADRLRDLLATPASTEDRADNEGTR